MAQTKERRQQYKNIVVEVPNELYEAFTAHAKSKGKSKSELVREMMHREMNQ